MQDGGFLGTTALSLDAKGRVTVPVRHRDRLLEVCQGRVTLTKHHTGCLQIFPEPVWQRFYAELLKLPASADDWRRIFLGSAAPLEMDSGSRLLVPPELRNWARLDKEVLMVGIGQRLELWDAARHAEHEARALASPMPEAVQNFVY